MSLQLKVRIVPEARQVVRLVAISVAAIGVLIVLIAAKGWSAMTLLMGIVAVVIGAVLIFQVHWAVRHLYRRSTDLERTAGEAERHYVDVLLRIIRFLETRDKYSEGRSERIGRLSAEVAQEMGLDKRHCELMNLAGQLHDIGLMAVPEGILNKRSALGGKDYRTVQKHSQISYEMLKPLASLSPVLPAVHHHHERMNGTGYPGGLTGDLIPLEARILAVTDAFDAITHDRPHRSALPPLEAMRELIRCSPDGFDRRCVEALAKIVHLDALERAAGATARLRDVATADQACQPTAT